MKSLISRSPSPRHKDEKSQGYFPPLINDYLSLIDAYITRGNLRKALEIINAVERRGHPEIQRRLKIIKLAQQKTTIGATSTLPRHVKKTDDLNKLLVQIKERRHEI